MAVPSTTSTTTMPARLGMPAGRLQQGGWHSSMLMQREGGNVEWSLQAAGARPQRTSQRSCMHRYGAAH